MSNAKTSAQIGYLFTSGAGVPPATPQGGVPVRSIPNGRIPDIFEP
jgi:hypothetical protein